MCFNKNYQHRDSLVIKGLIILMVGDFPLGDPSARGFTVVIVELQGSEKSALRTKVLF